MILHNRESQQIEQLHGGLRFHMAHCSVSMQVNCCFQIHIKSKHQMSYLNTIQATSAQRGHHFFMALSTYAQK